ncbi:MULTISPECIES: hypothetical protein [Bacteroides]|uniref:hypothetical protein n=1 Tax=Bacteroides TaxID=816 RepID=UPI0034A3D43D
MKKVLFILAMALPIICHAQCNEKTKEQLDSLKSSIPYPKFNIDDVLYIAFINDPNVGTINVTEKDINVKKVRIYNMSAYNSIEGSESSYVLSLRGTYPVEWQYQFIDTQIENPKYKDVSDFYSEDRFSTTAIGAKQILMKKD